MKINRLVNVPNYDLARMQAKVSFKGHKMQEKALKPHVKNCQPLLSHKLGNKLDYQA